MADVIRAVEGPCAAGGDPDAGGEAAADLGAGRDALRAVWAVLRANERAVLESVTLADLASGQLPDMSCLGRAHRG